VRGPKKGKTPGSWIVSRTSWPDNLAEMVEPSSIYTENHPLYAIFLITHKCMVCSITDNIGFNGWQCYRKYIRIFFKTLRC